MCYDINSATYMTPVQQLAVACEQYPREPTQQCSSMQLYQPAAAIGKGKPALPCTGGS